MVNLLLWNGFRKANPLISDMYITVLTGYLSELNQKVPAFRDEKLCRKAHHYLEHLEAAGIWVRTLNNDLESDLHKLVS